MTLGNAIICNGIPYILYTVLYVPTNTTNSLVILPRMCTLAIVHCYSTCMPTPPDVRPIQKKEGISGVEFNYNL